MISGAALTYIQDFALGLVEPHDVDVNPLVELVQVPLNGILSLRHMNRTTQLGEIILFESFILPLNRTNSLTFVVPCLELHLHLAHFKCLWRKHKSVRKYISR